MGILNVTPDSFYDGGRFLDKDQAVQRGLALVEEGADLLDVGGMSTRPGASEIPMEQEIERVIDVVHALSQRVHVPISIDTYRAPVARLALEQGAHIVNDISALSADVTMARLIRDFEAGVVLMHMRGTPETMQGHLYYDHLSKEILEFLQGRLDFAEESGIAKEQMVIDPGLGFGKSAEQNIEILRSLDFFKKTGRPLLIGPSRKSFIGELLGHPPQKRLWGTLASVAACFYGRVEIIRVHDVRAACEFLKVLCAIENI